jgi:hypothetical protein
VATPKFSILDWRRSCPQVPTDGYRKAEADNKAKQCKCVGHDEIEILPHIFIQFQLSLPNEDPDPHREPPLRGKRERKRVWRFRLIMFCDLVPYSDTAATELLNDAVMRDGLDRERGLSPSFGAHVRFSVVAKSTMRHGSRVKMIIAFIEKVTETRCGITRLHRNQPPLPRPISGGKTISQQSGM